ncbi:MAG: hypothetical protein DRJ45_06965 [Thermoprotei archaeon]|nr:MAG: hypothetical protein DRJ45_06965 [Thermoprotei archaeon]
MKEVIKIEIHGEDTNAVRFRDLLKYYSKTLKEAKENDNSSLLRYYAAKRAIRDIKRAMKGRLNLLLVFPERPEDFINMLIDDVEND